MTKATDETWKHKHEVAGLLSKVGNLLTSHGLVHDDSKLKSPEVEIFEEYTDKLKNTTYNSDEYKSYLKEMQVALDHHYENNRHHPEYFEEGIEEMNLFDLIEMVCDWIAATKRHADGNVQESLKKNKDRFNIPESIHRVLKNTVDYMKKENLT